VGKAKYVAKDSVVTGQVGIPAGYFLKMARHDYDSYMMALPREFYQNSIDAGATKIVVEFDKEKRTITVTDDGCGMTRAVLLDKLLVLGGSHKQFKSVGAFGKAKELLFFSWVKYEIETLGWKVAGVSSEYTVSPLPKSRQGTKCTVWIPEREAGYSDLMDDLVQPFKTVAMRTQTDCQIMINGDEFVSKFPRGKLVMDLEWGKLYLNESIQSNDMMVRIQGMWMFNRWLGDLKGSLIMELEHSSVEMLTSNRDNLKDKYRHQMETVARKIMVDRKTALEGPKPTTKRELMTGSGKIMVPRREILSKVPSIGADSPQWKDALAALAQTAEHVPFPIMEARMEVMKKQLDRYDTLFDHVDRLAFMGYTPDFILKYQSDQQAEVEKFMKTKTATDLAQIWGEIVKQVMLDNGVFEHFTAGFTFDKDRLAEIEHGGDIIVYLNPLKLGALVGLEGKPLSDRFRLMLDMQERAIHEISHLEQTYHDESFVIHMDRVRANTWKSYTVYSRIANWGRTWRN
jgi:hypothetical protein